MGDSRPNLEENSTSKSYARLILPQLPQEDNIFSHAATQWIEDAETAIIASGLLPIIADPPELPLASRIIIDTPLIAVPQGVVLSLRDQQLRMSIETENKRNSMKREKILLEAWTELYAALLVCSKSSAPLHWDTLRKYCASLVHLAARMAQFSDGPRAWRMTLHMLKGKARTKKDRQFYFTALQFQTTNKLTDGCTAEE